MLNLPTILALVIVFAICACAVAVTVIRQRNGKNGCNSGCEHCAYKDTCHKK